MWYMTLLVLIISTVSEKYVNAKTFQCKENSARTCTITDVQAQDDSIHLNMGYCDYIRNLTILNSILEDFPPISSRCSLSLFYLSCVGCGLTDITKHSFTPLSSLVALNISFGSYSKLHKNLFSQLPALMHLNVSYGAITEIDDAAFFNLRKLEKLDLSHNNISQFTRNMVTPLESVWFLDLSYNNIKILEYGLFANNIKLSYVSLRNNDISEIDGRIFNPLYDVASIDISYNELTSFDTQNTKKVWVHHNKIKELFLSNSTQFLNADVNVIENVTCDEKGSPINTLSLSQNSLTDLGCIGSLTQLTSLYLGYNNFGKLNHSSFAELTELTTLFLRSANIGRLDYGVFSHQNKLQTLDISYNRMGNIALEILLAAKGLQVLYIDGNNITELSYTDLNMAFTSLKTIGIGDNDLNCTFLGQTIKQLNSNGIDAIVSSGTKVTDSPNINGIGCHDKKKTDTPSWIPSVTINNSSDTGVDVIDTKIDVKLDAIIEQVENLSQMQAGNDKNFKKLSEDVSAVKQQIFKMNGDILASKQQILEIEVTKNSNSTSTSNTMWTHINQLNNITLEKQQISNRAQAQDMNELKFEIEKNSHKISDVAAKMEKLMKELTVLQSSSSNVVSRDTTKDASNSDYDFIKNVNIILITLFVAFIIYKGYKFVKNDLPRIRKYHTAGTLDTNIEMDNSCA